MKQNYKLVDFSFYIKEDTLKKLEIVSKHFNMSPGNILYDFLYQDEGASLDKFLINKIDNSEK